MSLLLKHSNHQTRRLILLLLVALPLFGIAGWYYRYSIVVQVRKIMLPDAQPLAPDSIRFAVIGDYGSGTPSEWSVALMVDSWNPDFVTTVGDNNYPDGSPETIDENIGRFYHHYISPYRGSYGKGAVKNRFFPVPGHVDWDSDALQPYLDYFTLPGIERYYDFEWGPVHFFMLDTDEREPDGATADSTQAQWLQRRLGESAASWKLVLAHHAPFTSHQVEDVERMRWPFRIWGADAVLSGYFHVYERLLVDGLPYFVNGTGGTWVSHFGEIHPASQFRYNDEYGAMIIDAHNDRIIFRFVNRNGKVIDRFVLDKQDDR
jgi:tartrate-resistant acid phosphatase type 5